MVGKRKKTDVKAQNMAVQLRPVSQLKKTVIAKNSKIKLLMKWMSSIEILILKTNKLVSVERYYVSKEKFNVSIWRCKVPV